MPVEAFVALLASWISESATAVFGFCLAFPVLGTLAARLGKAGRTDADGRTAASLILGLAFALVLLQGAVIVIAEAFLPVRWEQVDIRLLAGPPLCLAGCLAGIRWVFPLNSLASFRAVRSFLLILILAGCGLWLLSRFRGWGIAFLGGIGQLLLLAGLAVWLLRRLWTGTAPEHGATNSSDDG